MGHVRVLEADSAEPIASLDPHITISTKLSTYTTATALLTVPLGVLKSLPATFFDPPLPPRRLQSIHNLGMGVLNKIVLFYSSAWWPSGFNGFSLMPDPADPLKLTGPKQTGLGARASFVVNLDQVTGTHALVWFFGGDAGDALEESTDEEIEEWATGIVKQYLGPQLGTDPPAPTKTLVTRWREDPHSQGSYAYFPVQNCPSPSAPAPTAAGYSREGGTPLDCVELARPLFGGRLLFAGEHTEPDHFASVHGAYLSGVREARKIEDALVGFESED